MQVPSPGHLNGSYGWQASEITHAETLREWENLFEKSNLNSAMPFPNNWKPVRVYLCANAAQSHSTEMEVRGSRLCSPVVSRRMIKLRR